MSPRAARLAALALLATGCARDPAAEVRIDLASPCETLAPRVVDARIMSERTPLALVGDQAAPSPEERGWLLTLGPDGRALERLGEALAPIELEPPLATHTWLRPGARPGEAWVLIFDPSHRAIWRIDPSGEIVKGEPQDPFPPGPYDDYARALVFIDTLPFVVAVRAASEGPELDAWLAPIDAELALGDPWHFQFTTGCGADPQVCELRYLSRVRLLDVAAPRGRDPGHVLLGIREDVSEDIGEYNPRTLYAATLSFSLADTTHEPIAVLRTNYPLLGWEFSAEYNALIQPAELAVDDTGFYILAGLELVDLETPTGEELDRQVVRHSVVSGISVRFGALPAEYAPHLLQGASAAALGWFEDDQWINVPMRESDFELERARALPLEPSASRVLGPGGHGHYLLRLDGDEVARVAASCDVDVEQDVDLRAATVELPALTRPRLEAAVVELRARGR
ncbi:MAG: hypothetical protein H6713_21020 [Myxococcales bacterium]|nr:hypothetical protein [Myxococcales bacterium]MCB9752444.1 hypothetical protein [Myxococcales bacterium]